LLDVNDLLSLANVPFSDRDPDSLALRYSRRELEVNNLLADVSPDIFNQIASIFSGPLMKALQPIGVLERMAWLVVHQGAGASNEVAKLQALVDGLLESWVLLLALSRHGGVHALDPESPEALTGTQDWISRTTSSHMSFYWVNWVICDAIIATVRSQERWASELPSMTLKEFNALMLWSRESFTASKPIPLSDGQPGYELGLDVSRLSPAQTDTLRQVFQERTLAAAPLRMTKNGLVLATPRTFPTRAYVALLELADSSWNSGISRKGKASRDKGTLFELAAQRLLEKYLGISETGAPPYAIKLLSGIQTDLDGCWKLGDVWIITECKSYAPSKRADDAFTKLSDEVDLICNQLHVRTQALQAGQPVRSDSGEFRIEGKVDLIRLGITIDSGHSLTCRTDEYGDIHVLTLEGLVVVLGALRSPTEIAAYLHFRAVELATSQFQDECDLLIAFLRQSPPALHRLSAPGDLYFVPSDSDDWRRFLIDETIRVS